MDNFDLRKYLAEGRLFEEDFKNPILDKYLELKKSIDYKTVFPTDLQSFLDSLDNTEREGLENDLAENKLLKEDITKLRGQELLDFFSFTKYMNVDLEELESEFEDAQNYGQFTDPANVEQDKKDFTYENGDRFLDTNEDKMSEYLGFEIDTEQMIEDYTMGDPKGVEFVHSDEEFERWMEEGSSFWR